MQKAKKEYCMKIEIYKKKVLLKIELNRYILKFQ